MTPSHICPFISVSFYSQQRLASLLALLALVLWGALSQQAAAAEEVEASDQYEQKLINQLLWDSLKQSPGFVLLIPTAEAHGDQRPGSTNTAECYQRFNLTEHGEVLARRFYNTLRRNGIHKALTYSSQWCPALETATRLGLGYVHELALLNEFPDDVQVISTLQTIQLKNWITRLEYNRKNLLVLVTHPDIMAAISGQIPEPQHMQVMNFNTRDQLTYVGSLPLN
ncbi:hypothetical protein Q4551_02710 [Oceanobacter sp. 5_MG-2023]|uniref:hypothetical protein n=1 Tax=Oceanobacter sp. 5_MG-2023 TaxID=3062645 RepID=UPI0026E2E55E|nr:hypothetical protein [Oceanobacter sp. 5_MG-2023]MDO6681188.1 hypothetical protein [Oceanobacter sp. 5_MG-2023]